MNILGFEIEVDDNWTSGHEKIDEVLVEISESYPDVVFLVCRLSDGDYTDVISQLCILNADKDMSEYPISEWEDKINEVAEDLGFLDYVEIFDEPQDVILNIAYGWMHEDVPILIAGTFYKILNRSEMEKLHKELGS